jgi:class 3 adenylate cyclase
MDTTFGLADQHVPTGAVTFLFTDIEGSTSLAQRYPDALSSLLAQHHRILHETIAAHRGQRAGPAGLRPATRRPGPKAAQ